MRDALRVLFPFVGSQVGGATVSTVEMTRRLVATGHVHPIVVAPREGPSSALFRGAGVEPSFHDADVVERTRMKASTVRWSGKLRAIPTYAALHTHALTLLRRHRVDVVHVNEDRLVLPWGTAARRLGVRVVWHVRQERPNPLLDRLRLRLTDHMIFVADANRSRFAHVRHLPPSTTLHNVVDLRRFCPTDDVQAAKAAVGLDPERLTLTFLGNLFERKRPDWVLAAAAALQSRHPLQVLLIGAPHGAEPYVRSLRAMVASAPEPAHIHFLGARDDVPDLLRATDVLTLPSIVRGEAFPRAIIEGMACGLPIVATDVAGVHEAVDHGESGLLVDPERFDSYLEALDRLLGSPESRQAMGLCGHRSARSRFGGETMAHALVDIYDSLLRPKNG